MDGQCWACLRQLKSLTNEIRLKKRNKSYLIVNMQVRVESWVHPLVRPYRLSVSSDQDAASLRFWTSSGGCHDWITFRHTSFVWLAQRAMMAFRRILSPLPVTQWCRQGGQPKQMARLKDQKGKTMKPLIFNLDSHPLKHPMKKVMAMPGHLLVLKPVAWRLFDSSCWMVMHENPYCVDGGTLFESCQPFNTHGPGLGLHSRNNQRCGLDRITSIVVVKFDLPTHVSRRSHVPQEQWTQQTDKLLKNLLSPMWP